MLDPAGIAISTAANNQFDPERRLRRHELPRRLAGPPLRHELRHLRRARQPGRRRARPGRDRDLDGGETTRSSRASPSAARTTSSPGRTTVRTHQPTSTARVSQAGAVLDPAGIAISTAANDQIAPSVAFDGTNYLVAWQDGRPGVNIYDIYGARVSQAGAVLDCGRDRDLDGGERPDRPERRLRRHELPRRLAGRLSGTLRHLRAASARPAPCSTRPGSAISTAPNTQAAPSVAFDGTNYLVAWQDLRSGTLRHLRRAREPGRRRARPGRDRDLDGGEQPVRPERRLRRHELPGRLAGLPLRRLRHLRRARDPGRHRARPDGIAPTASSSIACRLRRHEPPRRLAGLPPGAYDIYGAREPAGAVLDPAGIPISTAPDTQAAPSIAFGGT